MVSSHRLPRTLFLVTAALSSCPQAYAKLLTAPQVFTKVTEFLQKYCEINNLDGSDAEVGGQARLKFLCHSMSVSSHTCGRV